MERFHSKFDDALKEKLSGHSTSVPDSVWKGIVSEVASPNSQDSYYWSNGKRGLAALALLLSLTLMGYILTTTRDAQSAAQTDLATIEATAVSNQVSKEKSSSSEKVELNEASTPQARDTHDREPVDSDGGMSSPTAEVGYENRSMTAASDNANRDEAKTLAAEERNKSRDQKSIGSNAAETSKDLKIGAIAEAQAPKTASSASARNTPVSRVDEQSGSVTPASLGAEVGNTGNSAVDPFASDEKEAETLSTTERQPSPESLRVSSGEDFSRVDVANVLGSESPAGQNEKSNETGDAPTTASTSADEEYQTSLETVVDDAAASDSPPTDNTIEDKSSENLADRNGLSVNENARLRAPFDFSADSLLERNWSIDFSAGPSYNYRTLDIESDRTLQEHKNEYDNGLTTVTLKLNVRRRLGKKLFATGGLEYLRLGERYDYSSAHATHRADNRYDYYSIPLGLEFVQPVGLRTALTVGLGGQYNILRYGQSSWLDPTDFSPQSHSNEGGAHPFADNNFAVYGGLGLRYRLRDHIDIVVEQRATHLTNSVYKEEVGIEQLSYAFQTFFGLGLNF